MIVSTLIVVFCALFALGWIFAASYILASPLPAMPDSTSPTVVDKQCREQVILYLLENSPQIINIIGWLWIRFYLVWRSLKFCMDEIVVRLMVPLVVSLATNAYGSFRRFWLRNDGPK